MDAQCLTFVLVREDEVMKQILNKRIKRNRLILKLGFASIGLAVAGTAFGGTIVGSRHDLSANGWSGGEICVVCHTPHNAQAEPNAPLWNHTVTTAVHTMYSSPTFNGLATRAAGPTGASKLCLSCHDGTVGIDAFGGRPGIPVALQNPNANFGTDLTNDHPISFTYDDALALADGALALPSAATVINVGEGADADSGTLAEMLVPTGELQCNSCHDVHNKRTVTGTKLLRISNASSGLCLTCHTK